jgi:prophage tail gpP-like protein
VFTVNVNSTRYDKYESLSFSRNIENNVGEFSLIVTDTSPRNLGVQVNDLIQILLDDIICFTGFIDKITISGGIDGRRIDISGRDTCADLVDGSIPDAAKVFKGKVSLMQVINKTMSSLGMQNKVTDTTKSRDGSKQVLNQKISDAGENAMSFIAKLAARHQVWVVANEAGNLDIMRAGERVSDLNLVFMFNGNGVNNILQASLEIDGTQLFNKIKVRGQSGVGYQSIDTGTKFDDLSGEAFELNARKSRYLEIKSSEVMTSTELKKRAIDEINLRKAKAFVYTVKVNYFKTKTNKLVRIGDVVNVQDEAREVFGSFIVAAFNVAFDLSSGTIVDLTLAPISAYQIVEIEDSSNKSTVGRKKGWHKKSEVKSNA